MIATWNHFITLSFFFCSPLLATVVGGQLTEYQNNHELKDDISALDEDDYGKKFVVEIEYTHQIGPIHLTQEVSPSLDLVEKFKHKARHVSTVSFDTLMQDYEEQLDTMEKCLKRESVFNVANTQPVNLFAFYLLGEVSSWLEALHHTFYVIAITRDDHNQAFIGGYKTIKKEYDNYIKKEVSRRFNDLQEAKKGIWDQMVLFYVKNPYEHYGIFLSRNGINFLSRYLTCGLLRNYFRDNDSKRTFNAKHHIPEIVIILFSVATNAYLLVYAIKKKNKMNIILRALNMFDFAIVNGLNLLQVVCKARVLNLTGILLFPCSLYEMYTMLSPDFNPMRKSLTDSLAKDREVVALLKEAEEEAKKYAKKLGSIFHEANGSPQEISDMTASYLETSHGMNEYSDQIKYFNYHKVALLPTTMVYPLKSCFSLKCITRRCIAMSLFRSFYEFFYFSISILVLFQVILK